MRGPARPGRTRTGPAAPSPSAPPAAPLGTITLRDLRLGDADVHITATGQQLYHTGPDVASGTVYRIMPDVALMLGWLVRHHPAITMRT